MRRLLAPYAMLALFFLLLIAVHLLQWAGFAAISTARADVYLTEEAFGYRAGTTDTQTAALQKAIDACWERRDTTLHLPPAGRIVAARVTYFPGLKVEGHGCTVQQPERGHAFLVNFESYQRKRSDNFDLVDRNHYIYSQPAGHVSAQTVFRDIRFVGHATWLQPEEFNQWQREHSHAIVCAGRPGGGKLSVLIERCHFSGYSGNAIYARDAIVEVRECTGHDIFRGLVSGTQNIELRLSNLTSLGRWGGLDIEPEGGGPVRLFADGLDFSADLDVATMPGSVILLGGFKIDAGPINLVNRASTCVLVDGAAKSDQPAEIRIRGQAGTTLLDRVAFAVPKIVVYERDGGGHVLRFQRCTNHGEPLDDVDLERNAYKRSAINTVTIDGAEAAIDIGG